MLCAPLSYGGISVLPFFLCSGLGFAVGADWQQMLAAVGELCRLPQAQLTS